MADVFWLLRVAGAVAVMTDGAQVVELLQLLGGLRQFANALVHRRVGLAGLGAQVQTDANLVEWNYGDFEGLTPQQIRAGSPDWLVFRDGCPGGESPEQVGARADKVIARARSCAGHVALFAHGHFLRTLGARWIGLPATGGCHFLLDTATLCVLGEYHGNPAILHWNAPITNNIAS